MENIQKLNIVSFNLKRTIFKHLSDPLLFHFAPTLRFLPGSHRPLVDSTQPPTQVTQKLIQIKSITPNQLLDNVEFAILPLSTPLTSLSTLPSQPISPAHH